MLLHNRHWLLTGHKIAVSPFICPHWLADALAGHDRSVRPLVSNNVVELGPVARQRARLKLVGERQAEK
jgi:hypothetical protein